MKSGTDLVWTATDNSLMSECTKCIKTERIPSDIRFVNSKRTSYRDDMRIKLEHLISRRADARDPELISVVRQFLDPPSRHQIKPVKQIVETPQSTEVLKLLNDKVFLCFPIIFDISCLSCLVWICLWLLVCFLVVISIRIATIDRMSLREIFYHRCDRNA